VQRLCTEYECQIGPVIDAKDLAMCVGNTGKSLPNAQAIANTKLPIAQLDHD
jgi:hypothetical protein